MVGMHHTADLSENGFSSARHLGFWSKLGGGSLTIAILCHAIMLLVGAVWVFQIIRPPLGNQPPDIIRGDIGGHEGPAARFPAKAPQPRPQMIPADGLPRIIAAGCGGLVIPDSAPAFDRGNTLPSTFGGASAGGGGLGAGNGPNSGPGANLTKGPGMKRSFEVLPPQLSKRCSKADRLARLGENGGTSACEVAVVQGLRWLKANQNSDGSWGTGNQAAMTGLALLAYFGHCETPLSDEFGQSCVKGITWLVDLGLKSRGRLATATSANSWPYEHAIATYALAEALTFCREITPAYEIPGLTEITVQAGQWIIDHQHANGGWAYQYATDGGHTDVSVTGWQLQALKACSHAGLTYRGMHPCVGKALKYLQSCQNPGGGFGYNSATSGERDGYFTLTGVGMLCHQIWDKGGSSEVRKAAKYILANTRLDYRGPCADLYGHYYESQAMLRRGGRDWQTYNRLFRDQLLDNQDGDGSWQEPGGGRPVRAAAAEYVTNKVYRTCLCTLMLEVYYRFLNTGGGNARDAPGI